MMSILKNFNERAFFLSKLQCRQRIYDEKVGNEKMSLGDELKSFRVKNKISQEVFAKELGVSKKDIANWENNKILPDLEMIVKMSVIYNLPLDRFARENNTSNNVKNRKLSNDTQSKKERIDRQSVILGCILMCVGIVCVLLETNVFGLLRLDSIYYNSNVFLFVGIMFFLAGSIIIIRRYGIERSRTNLFFKRTR